MKLFLYQVVLFSVLVMIGLNYGCQRLPGQYKLYIEQGNIIDHKQLERVKTGMSEEQVRFLLGNPVVANIRDPQEWIYYYKFIDNTDKVTEQYKVVLKFNAENRLISKHKN